MKELSIKYPYVAYVHFIKEYILVVNSEFEYIIGYPLMGYPLLHYYLVDYVERVDL